MALVWLLLALSWPSVVVDGVSVMRPQVTCLLQQIHHTASSTPDDQSKSSFQAIQMRSRDLNFNGTNCVIGGLFTDNLPITCR